jgi:hypothetical protein
LKLHELSTTFIANKQTLATAKNLVFNLSSILCVCLKLRPSHINCHPDTSSPLGNITISPNLAILPDKLCFVWISTRDTNLRKFKLPKYHRYGIELRTSQGRIFIFFKGGVEKLLVGCKRHHWASFDRG